MGVTEFIITCDSELKPDGSYDVKRFRELVRCKDCKWGEWLRNMRGDGRYRCKNDYYHPERSDGMPDREKEYIVEKLQESLEKAENDGCIYAKIRRPIVFSTIALLKEQEAEIRQLSIALDIAKGTCKGIKMEGR